MRLVFAPRAVEQQELPEEAAQRGRDLFAQQWSYRLDQFVIVRPDPTSEEPWWCAKIKSLKFKDPADQLWKCWVLWYKADESGQVFAPFKVARDALNGGQHNNKGWETVVLEAVQDPVSMTKSGGSKTREENQKYKVRQGHDTKVAFWADKFRDEKAKVQAQKHSDAQDDSE